jgi:hypothetical protein
LFLAENSDFNFFLFFRRCFLFEEKKKSVNGKFWFDA